MKIFYVLYLANVHGNVDSLTPVAIAENKQSLERWEKEQRADQPYNSSAHQDNFGQNHNYNLVYKVGSPIQWFNPPDGFGGIQEYHQCENLDDFQIANITKVF